MAISFNTVGSSNSGAQQTTLTLTIPAGVQAGDVMLLAVHAFFTSSFTPTIASTGTAFTQIGTNQVGGNASGFVANGSIWYAIASATDAGKVITASGNNSFWALTVVAYTGASNVTPIDVNGGTFVTSSSTSSIVCPSLTTGVSGDWAVYLSPWGINGMTVAPALSGATQRANQNGSGVGTAVWDSNGSVGASSTPIGGGTITGTGSLYWWTAFTVGLAPAGSGTPAASGSVMPPVIPPHPHFTRALLEEAWQRADWQAQGVADLTVAFSSSSGGVDTYNVTSPWDNYAAAGAQQMRVLKPTVPNANYPPAFLIMLPVDTNQGTGFGDSIGTAQTLGAHNTYNLTCVQPGYAPAGASGTGPWFGDNPLDSTISQEKYTLLVVNWIRQNLARSGTEKVYLIGFSRSGLAAQFLQFRHPYLFSGVASWDSPFGMTDYNGTDPNGTVSGNSADVFGTSASFQTNYELTAAYLANWKATGQYGVNRIWIGQGPAFTDITPYDAALTSAGIPHTFTFSNTGESHAWHTDWVAAALASIIPSNYSQAPTPTIVPHPLFLRTLLEVAERRMTTGTPAVTTWQGTATIIGAGVLTANVIQGAGASLTASGLLAASATQGAGASLAGAGTLASNIQQGSGGSFGGAGTLSVNAIQQVIAALAGTGTLTANVIQGAGASLTGLGVLASNVIQGSGGSMGGAGTLSVNATQDVIAALTGAGTLSAVVIQGATATLTGAGVVNTGSQAGGGSLSGSGAVSVNAIQGAGSPLTAAGLLAASVIQGAGLTAVASGLVTVSATELAGVTLTGLGVVTAAPAGGAKSALLLVFLP